MVGDNLVPCIQLLPLMVSGLGYHGNYVIINLHGLDCYIPGVCFPCRSDAEGKQWQQERPQGQESVCGRVRGRSGHRQRCVRGLGQKVRGAATCTGWIWVFLFFDRNYGTFLSSEIPPELLFLQLSLTILFLDVGILWSVSGNRQLSSSPYELFPKLSGNWSDAAMELWCFMVYL